MDKPGSKEKIMPFLYFFVAALLPLLLCSKCSPLYPFNDWPDVNVHFTVGKGMVHGRIPYVDLMDHKGPYVYALSAFAYLLSHDSFLGIFLVELLSMFFFLLYCAKIIRLYAKDDGACLWVLPMLSCGIVAAKSFVHGGSIEELCVGIFAYAIYSLLRFLRGAGGAGNMKSCTLAVNGLFAGILFWSKFTLLGLYLAWMLVLVTLLLARRRIRELFRCIGIFLAAFLSAALPCLFYFGYHHQTGSWLQVYLWNNIFSYTSSEKISLGQRFFTALLNAFRSIKDPENLTYGILLMAGCVLFCFYPRVRVSTAEKISVFLMGFFASLGIFIGGTKHDYYGLPLAVFSVFGALACALALEWLLGKGKQPKALRRGMQGALAACILAAGLYMDYRLSANVYLLSFEKADMPQYRFAEIIQNSDDETVLNYGFLDGGFYTVLDQVPVMPYFCVTNMNPDAVILEQNRYLKEGLTHWAVTWKAYKMGAEELRELPEISENYELVDYVCFPFEGDYRTYALYERRGRVSP